MAIRATCPGCGKSVKGGDDWVGREAKCPGCGATITFTAITPPPPPPMLLPDIVTNLADEQERWAAEIPSVPWVKTPTPPATRCATRPIYSGSEGTTLFVVLAVVMVVMGALVLVNAESAIHEILAGVAFIVASVLVACSVLCSIRNSLRDVADYAADLSRELSGDERTDLAEIKAELQWLRSVKEKEIVRAKAATRTGTATETAK